MFRGPAIIYLGARWNGQKLDPAWFYVSSLGGDFNMLTKIVRQAEKTGAKIALNPGSQEIVAATKLKAFLPKIEVLILNADEAKDIARR